MVGLIVGDGKMGQLIAALMLKAGHQVTLIPALNDPETLKEQRFDGIIDFSHPDATRATLIYAQACRLPVVLGTTGIRAAEQALIKAVSNDIPLLVAPNFATGFNALAQLAKSLCEKVDVKSITIEETHHQSKLDAPSGSALMLAAMLNVSTPIEVKRVGASIGEHVVRIELEDETIVLTHQAKHRQAFALGAIKALTWLRRQPPGQYQVGDYLKEE